MRLHPPFLPPRSRWRTCFAARRFSGLAGALLLSVCLGGSGAQPSTNDAPLSLWDVSSRVQIGGGHRGNVFLAHVAPEDAPFLSIGGDTSVIRISDTGSELTLFLVAEDLQYLDAVSVEGERFLSASAQFLQPLSSRDKVGAEVGYLYQHQVLDVSETEESLRRVLVEGHGLSLRPTWRHSFSPVWSLQLEAGAHRQFYMGELDDYWEASARLSLACTYRRSSEVAVGIQSAHWIYDSRVEADGNGQPLLDTHLFYWRPEVFSQWRHYFDEAKHWRATTRVAWLRNADSGSGYYDYDRFTLTEKLRWKHAPWEISAGARFGWYFYLEQQYAGESRERHYINLDLRIERQLDRHLFAFLTGEREWNYGTDPLDDYRDWVISGGLGVDF